MLQRVVFIVLPVVVLGFLAGSLATVARSLSNTPTAVSAEERLAQYRNLGKAFYENPTTQAEAVAEFKKALDLRPNSVREQLNYGLALLRAAKTQEGVAMLEKVQKEDPKLPYTWFNLGIYYKREGQFDLALRQLQEMAKLVPNEPITHYNLGSIYKLQNKIDLAKNQFELARDLNPSLAAPHFQLFNIYRQEDRKEEAMRELKLFNERKKAQDNDAIPKEDVEWCEYAEIYDPISPEPDNSKQPVRFTLASQILGKAGIDAGLVVLDLNGTGTPDLLVYSASGIEIYRKGSERVTGSGLEALRDVTAAVPGDFNNDGLPDLCVLTKSGAQLFENKKGSFVKSPFSLPQDQYNAAVWIDFDHDYDLDLILLGKKSVLMRNQGDAGFVEHPFPFSDGEAIAATTFRMVADSKSKDLIVSYKNKPATLYLDRLTADYQPKPLPQVPAGATNLAAIDLDNDGNLDVAFTSGSVAKIARNERTSFDSPVDLGAAPAGFADLANRGFTDVAGPGTLRQNIGDLHFIEPDGEAAIPKAVVAWAHADFNGDGLEDLAAITSDGAVQLLTNRTSTTNRWLQVKIDGVKNLKLARAAEIEVKAGNSYQKKIYRGLPLLFGEGSHDVVDTVRITWPNGLIQNEMKQATGKDLDFKEAQRLSGSCPLIFVWNGKEFQYVTDVLGVAPLGAMSGDGQYFPTDHTEYIPLSGSWLAPKKDASGRDAYEVHLTEELSEVSYFDQVQLVAMDHPAGTEIYSNEKWKSPPFAKFRLYGLSRRVYPVAARSVSGDVLDRVLHHDQRYVDDFQHNYIGVAKLHSLDLDFGKAAADNHAFLVLNGWVDWADGSTFLQQAQAKNDLVTPYLQVKDKSGKWVTVIADMGMPSGKPKTIAVDLTGKFLSDSREVRIVTNMCVYWDEIYLGESAATPEVKLTSLTPERSDVRFRGFSPSHIHPQRKQPEYFDYQNPTTTSYWNPTPGLYTRYGDTTELTESVDDRLVVMGSGDMLSLRFDGATLPKLPQGWRRDYLLRVEGWAKDRDANTAFSQSVLPLPFHGMSRYPYPAGEHYPDDALHREYVKKYLTRPALRLIRPLAPGSDGTSDPQRGIHEAE
jgi:tetratricopeptide (TPR) repeat protein